MFALSQNNIRLSRTSLDLCYRYCFTSEPLWWAFHICWTVCNSRWVSCHNKTSFFRLKGPCWPFQVPCWKNQELLHHCSYWPWKKHFGWQTAGDDRSVCLSHIAFMLSKTFRLLFKSKFHSQIFNPVLRRCTLNCTGLTVFWQFF